MRLSEWISKLENVAAVLAYKLKAKTGDKHTCPLRSGYGIDKTIGDYDYWEHIGGERRCSYCGSMHVADLEKVLDKIIDRSEPEWMIEMNDRRNKIYVHRPEIKNASQGNIKFKTAHLTGMDKAAVDRFNEKYMKARNISLGIFRDRLKEWFPKEG